MKFSKCLEERILILDGAMGTKIQSLGLSADHYHRGHFAGWPVSLTGNNDVLCLTAPEVIADIHRLYIEAGADIITTNTFSANRISQHEYGCEEVAREMARAGAQIARRIADEAFRYPPASYPSSLTPKKIWVAGSMGPTSKSLTLASDMSEASQRALDFDAMAAAYGEQAEALLEGGADLLLLETCFDALNTKAALYAIQLLNERLHRQIPVMVSATINDRSGRTLTGQTLEAFYVSISHYPYLVSFGLNCSFGITDLRPFVEQLSARIPVSLSLYPNAGLPNEMGEYDELPEFTADHLRQMAEAGLLNIAGGCCGTDERHIRAIGTALRGLRPRKLPTKNNSLCLSGLETIYFPSLESGSAESAGTAFTNIGERTNVAGSRKFARLIAEKKYDEALSVARHQIEGGASIIDINMDDAMLDSRQEMQTFCRYIAGDPAVGRAVLMIDSSDWPTVLAGLKNAQGKCIVNSISLKGGEEDFLSKARELRRLGAAVVVMAFDEEGQATTYERKTAIAQRAYQLLTGIGFPVQDIIFDVNILSVATGIKEHQAYAIDFIRAVAWIKQHLPLAKTSGGVSNLSFAFRGNNRVREAMHSVFLYHAVRAGLDMAIVNPAMLQVYDDIEPGLLKAVEDVILNTDDEATERLIREEEEAKRREEGKVESPTTDSPSLFPHPSSLTIEERLTHALSRGDTEHLSDDIMEALQKYGRPIDVIEQPLMKAMAHIGQLFGEGKMFLPQVVKSARVMKDAVALLQPYIDAGQEANGSGHHRPCVVLATANGDVHDIGKNIVGIVLGCNGFEVVDLGVMVPAETILEATLQHKPCIVGISGLITPSLKEMELLCRLFQREGLRVPIVVGGATTSAVHTAVKLAPFYDGCVVYGGDASQTSLLAKRLQMDPAATIAQIKAGQEQLRTAYEEHHAPLTPYDEANRRAPHFAHPAGLPTAADLNAQFNLQSSIFNLQPSIFNLQPSIFNLQPSIFSLRQLHHHHGGQSSGLCAQAALAQVYRDVSGIHGHAHLVDREVALGPHHHKCVLVGSSVPQLIEEIRARHLLVAMGYVAAASGMAFYETPERCHLADHGQPCLAALLHGRDDDFLYARHLHGTPLGELAAEQRQLVDAHLGSLLCEPFHAVHELRRGDGQMHFPTPLPLLRQLLHDVVQAALLRGIGHHGAEEAALSVHQHHLVAGCQAQHAHGVHRLLVGQCLPVSGIGHIEIAFFLHRRFRSFTSI